MAGAEWNGKWGCPSPDPCVRGQRDNSLSRTFVLVIAAFFTYDFSFMFS